MDVAYPNFMSKGKSVTTVSSERMILYSIGECLRKTSCSSGWLRLVLQSTFAVITVTSFCLIVVMAVRNPQPAPGLRPPLAPSRCFIQGCSVICKEAPYFEKFEYDIIQTVMEADTICGRVSLDLQKPCFTNSTLPNNWLSRLRIEVYQLSINGGNLEHIPSGAFMAQFMGYIQSLVLQNIRISTFESTSLVGLSSLRTFNIMNSSIDGVQENVLRAIDDTLESFAITECGDWDPNVFTGSTGFEKLTIVNFSYNNFNQILNKNSFVGLEVTKILYLNSCEITAIGAGTFDHLKSIEVIYLNNNKLSTVPPGLFNTIVALDNPRPRINLQDNYWYCDCSVDDLRQLVRKELLLVEVGCTFPDTFSAMNFTQFEYACNNGSHAQDEYKNSNAMDVSETYKTRSKPTYLYANRSNCDSNIKSNLLKLISPVENNECSSKNVKRWNLSQLVDRDLDSQSNNLSKWLQFSYFIKTDLFSVIQIVSMKKQRHYGLIWYQSICPHEIYCLEAMPNILKLYDAEPSARYTFCPIYMKNGTINNVDCIDISVERHISRDDDEKKFRILLYLLTILLCSCFGALVLYGLIRRKPTLLKGSKRILFVKHKNVDALVLPPKIPPRNDLIDSKDKKVFTLTSGHNDKLKLPNVNRGKSVKSNKSGSPSYISAMQPTDDQLAEWRIKSHFNNDLTIDSRKSEISTVSWIGSTYFYSPDGCDTTYESLK